MLMLIVFLFFKHKSAYEMRISDWSSDVCSSDLGLGRQHDLGQCQQLRNIGLGFAGQRKVPVIGGQAKFFVALDGTADRTFARVVGGQSQQPVAVEHVVQARQVVHRGCGGGGDVTTPVIEAGLAQVEVAARGDVKRVG